MTSPATPPGRAERGSAPSEEKDKASRGADGDGETDGEGDEEGPRPPRRALPQFDSLVKSLEDQAPLILRSEVYRPADVVKKIKHQLVKNPNLAAREEEIAASLSILGSAFGCRGTDHLRSLYREYYQSWQRKGGLAAARRSADIASELGTLGCAKLSQLFRIWAGLKQAEALPARCKDLQRLHAYLELVRIWESFSVKKIQGDELARLQRSPRFQTFLDTHKLRNRKGVTQQSQLTSFVADQLQLTKKQFSLTVSRYRPLAVLAKHLGDGILGFLPLPGLLPLFNHLRARQGPNNLDEGELILSTVIDLAKSNMPGLIQLCASVEECIVTPILETTSLPMTTGLGYLIAGDKEEFNSRGIWNLVDSETATRAMPRVREITAPIADDANDPGQGGGSHGDDDGGDDDGGDGDGGDDDGGDGDGGDDDGADDE